MGKWVGVLKIRGWVEGLTGWGHRDRASRLMCKAGDKMCWSQAVSVENVDHRVRLTTMLGRGNLSQGRGLTRPPLWRALDPQPLHAVDTPVTKSLLSISRPCGSGAMTRKLRLSKGKPPQQQLRSPETTR